jgi:hypothetical protein
MLGLYVVDEANLETHGFDPLFLHDTNHPAHNPTWLPAILERGARCDVFRRGSKGGASWARRRCRARRCPLPPCVRDLTALRRLCFL